MSTSILFKSLPEQSGTSIFFQFVRETATKRDTTRESVKLGAMLADNGKPKAKADAIAIARMYAAVAAHRKALESAYFAEYRKESKVWRERCEALAENPKGMNPGPKPSKPPVDTDTATSWATMDSWMDEWRKRFGDCGKHTFSVGQWHGTLSAVLMNRPNMVKIAIG